jgi:predicted N-acetyltransferase YhbS
MEIRCLSDDQHEIRTVARWCFDEWGHLNPDDSLDARITSLTHRVNATQVPLTLVAVADDGVLLGTASLIVSDMDTRPGLTPWLASVYVAPPHRGQGIGKQLCWRIVTMARELSYVQCYLFTPSEEAWYRRQGWHLMQREPYRGESVSVMRYDLS